MKLTFADVKSTPPLSETSTGTTVAASEMGGPFVSSTLPASPLPLAYSPLLASIDGVDHIAGAAQ